MKRTSRLDQVRATLLAFVLVVGLLPLNSAGAVSGPSGSTDVAADSQAQQAPDESTPDGADQQAALDEPAVPGDADVDPAEAGGDAVGAQDAPGAAADLGQPSVVPDAESEGASDPAAPSESEALAEGAADATGAPAPSVAPSASDKAAAPAVGASAAAALAPQAEAEPATTEPPEDDPSLEPQVDTELFTQALTPGDAVTLSRDGTTSWSSSTGGREHTVTLASEGLYSMTIKGGKGGNVTGGGKTGYGAQGGTTSAVMLLAPETLYVCTAGAGGGGSQGSRGAGGANGGGAGGSRNGSYTHGAGGGGASHVAKVSGELREIASDDDLYLVAGGGGGARNEYNDAGQGGGLSGGNSYTATNGGTQTTGYARGLGQNGPNGVNASGNHAGGGGGGGGYWGGRNSIRNDPKKHRGTGGGGSGFLNAALMGGSLVDNGGGAGSVVVDGVTVATTSRGGGTGAGTATVTLIASVVSLDAGASAEAAGTEKLFSAPQSDAYYSSYSVSGLADQVEYIAVPVREGFRFMGYFTAAEGGECLVDGEGKIASDLFEHGTCTLFAQWRPTVTFYPNGVDAAGMPAEEVVATGERATRPADPSAEGKSFKGWSTSATVWQPYDFSVPVTAGVQLFAFWSPYVSFDMRGHGEAIPAQWLVLGASGQKAERPDDPVEEGYTFGGWYADPECEGDPFDFDTVIESDTTLYAKWSANIYHIRLIDGDAEKGVESFVYNDAPKNLLTAAELGLEREGWRFAGWREDDALEVEFTDGQPIHNLSTGTGTIDFHALWVRDITFVSGAAALSGQSGAGALSAAADPAATSTATVAQLSDRDTNQAIAAPLLEEVPGWRALGWLGSKVAASSSDVDAGTAFTPQSVTTFYGLYNRDVTLAFDGAGATAGAMEPMADVQRMNASGTLTALTFVLPANDFERDGYRFAGWSMGRPGDAVTLRPSAAESPDYVASAVWGGPFQYFIAFDANGGAGAMGVQLALEHTPTPLDAAGFSRDGFAFAGWNTAQDGSGTSFAPGQSVTDLVEPGYQVVLYAQWTELPPQPADPSTDPASDAEKSEASDSAAAPGARRGSGSARSKALPNTGDPLGWLLAWWPLA